MANKETRNAIVSLLKNKQKKRRKSGLNHSLNLITIFGILFLFLLSFGVWIAHFFYKEEKFLSCPSEKQTLFVIHKNNKIAIYSCLLPDGSAQIRWQKR